MTKKNDFDDDVLIDQPDVGGYYYGNMFRFPEEELMRPQIPASKKASPMKEPKTYQEYMPSDMPDMTPEVPQTPQTPIPMAMPSQGGFPDEETILQPTLTNINYTQAYLRTLIGKRVRVSFLIGTSLLVDRVGTLLEVGISYIVLRQLDANINVMADLYSIKFVDIYDSPPR